MKSYNMWPFVSDFFHLALMFLRFIHIVLHTFLCMHNIPHFPCNVISLLTNECLTCPYFLLFINSSADNIHTFVHIMLIIASEYLWATNGWAPTHFGAIMNNAALNIHVQIFLCEHMFWILSWIYLGVEMLGHVIILY